MRYCAQQATQVGVVQHHDVVEALAAEGADETFHVRILPRRPRRRLDFADPHGLARGSRTRPRRPHRGRAAGIAGPSPRGTPPRVAGAVHWAVGASVTLKWTTRRRWCARTTKTNNTLNVTVGTVKKSTETRVRTWLSRKVRQVCDGGFRRRTTYLDTVACEISMPSFCSSRVSRVTLTCSAGGSPAGARASSPVAWMAG